MGLYDSVYYGGGSFYGSSGTDVPTDLRFYRTNVDNVYVFHWGFDEFFISPVMPTLDFELQLDTSPLFTSPALTSFTSATVIGFQNGDVRKGFAVPVSVRQDGTEQTWYARVRTLYGIEPITSAWSLTLQFQILEKFEVEEAEKIINNLPDYHVYGKEDILKPVASRSSKLYTVANMYGKELDQTFLENILTTTNNYISLCRDEQLFDNFGYYFDFRIPTTLEFVEYRMALLNLILGSMVGGTIDAVQRVVRSFTGVTPEIQLIRERNDFFLTTILETPPETPDGSITHFSTSVDYIPFSMVVYKDGLKKSLDTDYTENHATPGVDFIVPPGGGSIIQFFFDVGTSGDPDPVVFDITDTTTLSGTLTFTNGSKIVAGSSTAFTTELQEGRVITDTTGIALGTIDQILNDTSLLLVQNWIGSSGSGAGKVVNFNGATHLTGVVNFTNGNTSVTGVGTLFSSELQVGDTTTDNSGTFTGIVNSIISNTSLTLQSNWTGTTNSSNNARKLVYSESILWDKGTLAYGFIINVLNPGQFILDEELIKALVNKLIPSHTKVFFEFV